MTALYDPLSETITHVLSNGLKIFIVPMQSNGTVLEAVVNVGPKDDPVGKEGLAHFLEHRMSGESDMTLNQMMGMFDEVGGSLMPGSTSWTRTKYGIRIPLGITHLERFVPWFANFLFANALEKCIEDERQVILREYSSKFSSEIDEWSYFQRNELLWGKQHLITRAGNPLGNISSIGSIILDDLREYYSKYYTPEHTTLFVVTGDDPQTVLAALANSRFAEVKNTKESHREPACEISILNGIRDFEYRTHCEGGQDCDLTWIMVIPNMELLPLRIQLAVDQGGVTLDEIIFNEVRETHQLSYGPGVTHHAYGVPDFLVLDSGDILRENIPLTSQIFGEAIERVLESKSAWESNLQKHAACLRTSDPSPKSTMSKLQTSVFTGGGIITLNDQFALHEQVCFSDFQTFAEQWLDPENRYQQVTIK